MTQDRVAIAALLEELFLTDQESRLLIGECMVLFAEFEENDERVFDLNNRLLEHVQVNRFDETMSKIAKKLAVALPKGEQR